MTSKSCNNCKEVKAFTEFSKNKLAADNLQNKCKACNKAYRAANIERIREDAKIYYENHKEDFYNRGKKRREVHTEDVAAYLKRYGEDNKDDLREKSKIYRIEHRSELREANRLYSKTIAFKDGLKRYQDRYPNAHRSRIYYGSRRHKVSTPIVCSNCMEEPERMEAHHSDYNFPMDVVFLCKQCHANWHMNNTPINRVSGIFT